MTKKCNNEELNLLGFPTSFITAPLILMIAATTYIGALQHTRNQKLRALFNAEVVELNVEKTSKGNYTPKVLIKKDSPQHWFFTKNLPYTVGKLEKTPKKHKSCIKEDSFLTFWFDKTTSKLHEDKTQKVQLTIWNGRCTIFPLAKQLRFK